MSKLDRVVVWLCENLITGKPQSLTYVSIDHYGTLRRFIQEDLAILLQGRRDPKDVLYAPPKFKESYFGFKAMTKKEAVAYLDKEIGPIGSILNTPEENAQSTYLHHDGNKCPGCGSTEIESCGTLQADTAVAWQKIMCTACAAEWIDQYKLTGFADLEAPK